MDEVLVSVIIVTWNRKADVLTTIASVQGQAYQNHEIIVVDNGSTDGTCEAVRARFPNVTVIGLDTNKGAAEGRNAGIGAAKGEIVFILDSDASLGDETLTKVVRKFRESPELGAIACKVVNAYSRKLDNIAGWIFSEKDKADQDREFLSFSFSACGCAMRQAVFERAGVFWATLFFLREEEDLSLRIWDSGYQILYFPEALVYHRVSPDKRVVGGSREYYDLRNSLYIYVARYPWWMLLWFTPLRVGVSLVRGARGGYLRQNLRALGAVIFKLPFLLRQRRAISNRAARQYIRLQREHGPLRWDLVSWIRYKS